VLAPFPPNVQAAPAMIPASGPLGVLRRSPEGDVDVLPGVRVTFSQPMVPLATVGRVAEGDVPIRLTPQPPGRWRWLDTRTVNFEPAGGTRMPKATRSDVEIPSGTRSATGGLIGEAVKWTFTTPAPRMLRSTPNGGPNERRPNIGIVFDQRVDARAVLDHVTIRAGKALVEIEPVELDSPLREWFAGAQTSHCIAFRPDQELPLDTQVVVTIGAGTPSAEGPLVTTEDQQFEFRTHGAFRVLTHRCGWDGRCPPGAQWNVELSNPIDEEALDPALVKVVPAIEGLSVHGSGSMLWTEGATQERTRYELRLPAGLRDVFGQELGREQRLTFDVGSAEPRLSLGSQQLGVILPSARPGVPLLTAGLRSVRLRLWPVAPADWDDVARAVRASWQAPDAPFDLPGRKPIERSLRIKGDPDRLTETLLELSPALKRGLGHVLVSVDPEGTRPEHVRGEIAWIQVTGIGLDALLDGERILAWATNLGDGAPLEGVALHLLPGDVRAMSDAGGLASLTLPDGDSEPRLLVARRGDDVAFLPEQPGWGWEGAQTGWRKRSEGDVLTWHVLDDRGLYRPGETARLKGWVRRIGMGLHGNVASAGAGEIGWTLVDSVGNELSKGVSTLSTLGAFDLVLALPEGMNLGSARVDLVFGEQGSTSHALRVEEFRRPEYEVVVQASGGSLFVGESTTLTAAASYYAGGGLPNTEVTWNVAARRGEYRPPHRDDFAFGRWRPWWRPWWEPESSRTLTHASRTDASGEHRLRLDFDSVDPPEPTSVTAEATIMDVNRQAWSARTELLVHPSSLYVGLRLPKLFVERGERLRVDAIVTDLDGAAVAGREISVRAALLGGRVVKGAWIETEEDVVECRPMSGVEPVACDLELTKAGSWRVTARVRDARGRVNETTVSAWMFGQEPLPPGRLVEGEAEIIPDRPEYRGGETARLLIRSPFAPAEGILTMQRAGIVSEQRFTLAENSAIVEIAIDAAWAPGVTASVVLVGTSNEMPAFASGSISLKVPPRDRMLGVTVAAREPVLEPGGTTTLDLHVTDAGGTAVEGEVTVIVADEAVLALAGYELLDPLATFVPERSTGVQTSRLRENVLRLPGQRQLADVVFPYPGEPMAAAMESRIADGSVAKLGRGNAMPTAFPAGEGLASSPIALRADLSALALFEPAVPLDADGRASVTLKLPDTLTRYRVMAIAVAGTSHFGKAEATVTARKPLMVRPSPPRFLNFGDRFELPVVVQNQLGTPMTAQVALRLTNATMDGPAAVEVTIPPEDRVELRFPVAAASAGIVRLQAVAASGSLSDAITLALPTWTPATSEAFAVYGTIDAGTILQPVVAPEGVLPQFGGLSLTTSSTALHELGDAVLYLHDYPFECSEQLASKILAITALRDAVGAFSQLPPPEQLDKELTRDIDALIKRQRPDGSFGLWRRDGEPHEWPYVSVHAAHALVRAQAKGLAVPPAALEHSRRYLRDVERHVPEAYGLAARRTIIAQALHVRRLAGDAAPGEARRLAEAGANGLPLEALAWILPTLAEDPKSHAVAAAGRQRLLGSVSETAGAASFVTSASELGDDAYLVLGSDRRIDAIALEALLETEPNSDLVPKLVRGLLDHRVKGRWSNTQENVFVLLALDRYFRVHEKAAPDFRATAWLGAATLLREDFRGRSTDRRVADVPMRDLLAGPAQQDVVLAKDGPGRLYWRLGLSYAPASLSLPPSEQGFAVERSFEAVADPADVRRDEDGTWHIRAGALVKVRIRMAAPSRRTHVALVCPLPAGLEIVNTGLATSQQVVADDAPDSADVMPRFRGIAAGRMAPRVTTPSWSGRWFEHENLRDDRAEAFASLLQEGAHEHEVLCRATTPGRFVVPPAKAEEMYHPETFGRSATDLLIVDAASP
jgi:uncharacterized protein YfaS (alpha-2-macroglobulin family)